MGKYPRRKPAKLGEKLKQIRYALQLSQDGMLTRLGLRDPRIRTTVSSYERGGEPELETLLKYARLIDVAVELIIDDGLELPRAVLSAAKRGKTVLEAKRLRS